MTKLKDEPFEFAAFPCNQFLNQESGDNAQVERFIRNKLEPSEGKFTILDKCFVNGCDAHPVFQFLRYNSSLSVRGSKVRPIGWNFGKFLVDKDGQVYGYYPPGVSPLAMEQDIRGLLAGTLRGSPSKPPPE
mmetsp:Transcript_11074/g.20133  ORF Transcript_11074/g.20133 Transcript_11074/m.20133 type:complete len:132 (+) Transcript_11074:352-747(+)